MKRILKYLMKRATEPSSQAGLAAILLALGLPADILDDLYKAFIGVSGAAAIFFPEATTKTRD